MSVAKLVTRQDFCCDYASLFSYVHVATSSAGAAMDSDSQEAVHVPHQDRHSWKFVRHHHAGVLPAQPSQAAPPAAHPMFHGAHRGHELLAKGTGQGNIGCRLHSQPRVPRTKQPSDLACCQPGVKTSVPRSFLNQDFHARVLHPGVVNAKTEAIPSRVRAMIPRAAPRAKQIPSEQRRRQMDGGPRRLQ